MSEQVGSALRTLLGTRPAASTGVASEVDQQAKTCTVTPHDGNPPVYNVRYALLDNAPTYVIPAEGSEVIYTHLSDQVAVILHTDQVQEVSWKVGDTVAVLSSDQVQITGKLTTQAGTSKFSVSDAGIGIEANGQSLASVLQELVSALQVLAPIAAAPGSPCVPNPADVAKLTLIASKLSLVLP